MLSMLPGEQLFQSISLHLGLIQNAIHVLLKQGDETVGRTSVLFTNSNHLIESISLLPNDNVPSSIVPHLRLAARATLLDQSLEIRYQLVASIVASAGNETGPIQRFGQ
jgi:hypothetical protein